MIKGIQRVRNLGIFSDYQKGTTEDFGKYNLIYGWNGSGKTTLVHLFRSLEKRQPPNPDDFPTAEFKFSCADVGSTTHNNIFECNLNVRTFNQNFIEENIDWDKAVKGILILDKSKVDETKELGQLKPKQTSDQQAHSKEKLSIEKLGIEISKFLTSGSKRIKTSLQVIDTKDSHFLYYNKTKFEDFIRDNNQLIKSKSSLLSDDAVAELTKAARPDQKPLIQYVFPKLAFDKYKKAKERLEDLLRTSVAGNTIKRLTEHPDIQKWVLEGLTLHSNHNSDQCEFCGNTLTGERKTELEMHFNEEYRNLKNRLTSADEWLKVQYVEFDSIPLKDRLYQEFRNDYENSYQNLKMAVEPVNVVIKKWHEALKNKADNPFNTTLTIEEIDEQLLSEFNNAVKAFNEVIRCHDQKSINFEEETKKSKFKLELHYANSETSAFDYFTKREDVVSRIRANKELQDNITQRETKIREIENSLSNEGIGAEQFNKSLHRFIGRSELSLVFNKSLMGYEIIRNNVGTHDRNLSEGEKTAIAFVYFVTKLSESDNKLKDTIVVVDDPVSSFDSNHLFHAYSFLRINCSEAKQLFIFTHNFTFFKLVRDWYDRNNQTRKKKGKAPHANFYVIETTTESPRTASLNNAGKYLTEFQSEYHYLFSKLFKLKNQTSLSCNEAFLSANLSRKLLESFFCFKFPSHRSDLSQLMDSGLKDCTITTQETKEKIYRFINKYSHSDVIEINEDSFENLIGESNNVIGDIFTWMGEVDPIHLKEMEKVVNN